MTFKALTLTFQPLGTKQACSQANVEVFQGFPDGVPRKVIITGSLEEVDLAVAMVQEVSCDRWVRRRRRRQRSGGKRCVMWYDVV